jgi:hypothetical protein
MEDLRIKSNATNKVNIAKNGFACINIKTTIMNITILPTKESTIFAIGSGVLNPKTK